MKLKLNEEEKQKQIERGKKTMATGVLVAGVGCLTTLVVIVAVIVIMLVI